MSGWTTVSVAPTYSDRIEELATMLRSPSETSVRVSDTTNTVVAVLYGYGRKNEATSVLDQAASLWDEGAIINANDTSDSGNGVLIESDGRKTREGAAFAGAEGARAHDVREKLDSRTEADVAVR